MNYSEVLAREFSLQERHVGNIISLIDEGNTIPFIARYRKEMTGACDDQVLRELGERLEYLRKLEERKAAVKEAIESQGKLTDELTAALDKAVTLTEVEDIYRPYKVKRKTRAVVAAEKGLAPLAELLFAQAADTVPEVAAAAYVDPDKGVNTVEEALAGASDIIAEGCQYGRGSTGGGFGHNRGKDFRRYGHAPDGARAFL